MQVSCPIELTPGHKSDHAKEGEDVWVRRVLGVADGDKVSLMSLSVTQATLMINGRIERVTINTHRARALLSWMKVKFEQLGLFGSVAVIANHSLNAVILQMKDDKHPNEACRDRLSVFGGTRQASEDPIDACIRELYEEIRDPVIVDQIVAQLANQGEFHLAGIQWPGEYVCHMNVAQAESNKQFEHWVEAIMKPDALSESNPAVLRNEILMEALQQERHDRGSRFIASHNSIIEIALGLAHA